jgi:hypothetical protein
MTMSGLAAFINSSCRSTIWGIIAFPPSGSTISLSTNTLPNTASVNCKFYQALTNVYCSPPYVWSFNGNQISNPLNNFFPGGNTVTLQGYAPQTGNGDVILELDGNN